jgi:hypothetical protein
MDKGLMKAANVKGRTFGLHTEIKTVKCLALGLQYCFWNTYIIIKSEV